MAFLDGRYEDVDALYEELAHLKAAHQGVKKLDVLDWVSHAIFYYNELCCNPYGPVDKGRVERCQTEITSLRNHMAKKLVRLSDFDDHHIKKAIAQGLEQAVRFKQSALLRGTLLDAYVVSKSVADGFIEVSYEDAKHLANTICGITKQHPANSETYKLGMRIIDELGEVEDFISRYPKIQFDASSGNASFVFICSRKDQNPIIMRDSSKYLQDFTIMAYAVDDQIANSGFGNVPLTRLENRAFGLMKVCRNAAVKAHNDGLYVDAYRFMEKCALIQRKLAISKRNMPAGASTKCSDCRTADKSQLKQALEFYNQLANIQDNFVNFQIKYNKFEITPIQQLIDIIQIDIETVNQDEKRIAQMKRKEEEEVKANEEEAQKAKIAMNNYHNNLRNYYSQPVYNPLTGVTRPRGSNYTIYQGTAAYNRKHHRH